MKTTMAVERANLQDPAPAALARRHRSCWIHVSFGVAPVLSLPQNGANDPQQTFIAVASLQGAAPRGESRTRIN